VTKPFCPHCGYDLMVDTPILINDFAMFSPLAQLTYKGRPVKLTPYERSLCWTLMKAYPEPVRVDIILDRLGSEADTNVVDVFVCRARKKIRDVGAGDMFRPTSYRGNRAYAWTI
jgi:DNA-binding response OmpR family regulator